MRLLIALVIACFSFSANAQLAPSTWVNQRGSGMQFAFWSPIDKKIFGSYTNRAPGFPRCANVPYLLWGETDGRNITFTVRWSGILHEDCRSTTVWAGQIVGNQIRTNWKLTTDDGRVLRGSDFFTRR